MFDVPSLAMIFAVKCHSSPNLSGEGGHFKYNISNNSLK